MSIAADVQSLTPGNIVVLYELDTTVIGGSEVLRFHSGTGPLGANVVWGGHTYTAYPIEVEGFERATSGSTPRPRIKAANVDGMMGQLAKDLGGLEGAKLTRLRTFLKYLDPVNFEDGVNPNADSSAYIEREIWFVSRKSAENRVFIEFELAPSFDMMGIKLPRRQYIQNVCPWRYRSAECSYAGGPVANERDEPVTQLQQDRCGKRISSCKLRFGENAVLPYGGFPGVGLIR